MLISKPFSGAKFQKSRSIPVPQISYRKRRQSRYKNGAARQIRNSSVYRFPYEPALSRLVDFCINQLLSHQTGAFRIEFPAGDQILHSDRIIAAAKTLLLIKMMRLFQLIKIDLHAKPRHIPRYGHTAVHNLRAFPAEPLPALLPDPPDTSAEVPPPAFYHCQNREK